MALAYDSTATGTASSVTSLTVSHTCSGLNRLLVVAVWVSATTDVITGVTYNAVAMTRGTTIASGTGAGSLVFYYLIAPATGANNIIVSTSGSTIIKVCSASYTGANQSAQPSAASSGTGNSTTITAAVAVTSFNTWVVMTAGPGTGTYGNLTGTQRQNISGPMVLQDSNGVVATGSQSLSATATGGNTNSAIMSISAAPVPVAPSLFGNTGSGVFVPTLIRTILPTLFGIASVVFTAVTNIVAPTWRAQSKTAATWTAVDKS